MPDVLRAFEAALDEDLTAFEITGAGTVLENVAASDLAEGHFSRGYRYGDLRGPALQEVMFEVAGTLVNDPDSDGVLAETEAARWDVGLEGLRTCRLSGTITTAPLTQASAHFVDEHTPQADPEWQITYGYEVNETDTECRWEVTSTELLAVYPTSGGDRVVDGEKIVSQQFDEHNRKVTRTEYSYTGPYAKDYVEAQHTALRSAGGLLRAQVSWTTHKTLQATGSFEVLTCRAGTGETADLLEASEQISHSRSGPVLREVQYPGTTPLIVLADQAAYLYEQSGRAVGLRKYPQPPAYSFDVAALEGPPEITLTHLSDQEFETTWRFRFLFAAEQTVQKPHGRASWPGFYT
jgi:hypothetical protein